MAQFQPPDTSHLERAAYLVGDPIAHSKSPVLHHAIYSAVGENWGQVLAETKDLGGFLKYMKSNPKSMGSGVTMPYKVAVIPYLDELTEEGKAIGAINTIVFKPGPNGSTIYSGTNTDCIGIRDAFLNNVEGSSYRGKPGLVVGGGGTCRAAVYALRNFLGCSPIYIVNRDKAEVDAVLKECHERGMGENLVHVASTRQAKSLSAPGAVVSAVPDFAPVTENEKTAREILAIFLQGQEKGPLLEMCYHPSPDTEISRLAAEAGWQVIGGIEAMIGQGIAQAQLWTGINADEQVRSAVRSEIQKQMLASRH
jgi:quinate dehydrogenase